MMTVKLREKAKENFRRNEESRKKDSNYVKLEPGEKTTLHFDPEKIEPVDVEFEGKKSIRYQYTVTDPKEPEKVEIAAKFVRNKSIVTHADWSLGLLHESRRYNLILLLTLL
jgi:hypothetical protein